MEILDQVNAVMLIGLVWCLPLMLYLCVLAVIDMIRGG